MWQALDMAKTPNRRTEGGDDDHVGVRIKRKLRRRLNTYASSQERDKQDVLDDAVDEYLRKRGA